MECLISWTLSTTSVTAVQERIRQSRQAGGGVQLFRWLWVSFKTFRAAVEATVYEENTVPSCGPGNHKENVYRAPPFGCEGRYSLLLWWKGCLSITGLTHREKNSHSQPWCPWTRCGTIQKQPFYVHVYLLVYYIMCKVLFIRLAMWN